MPDKKREFVNFKKGKADLILILVPKNMLAREESRWHMYLKVKEFLKTNAQRLSSIPYIAELQQRLEVLEKQLEGHSINAISDKSGYTKSKRIVRTKLENHIYRLNCAIESYCTLQGLVDVVKEVHVPRFRLSRCDSMELLGRADVTHGYAKQYGRHLHVYGTNQSVVAALGDLMVEYRNVYKWPENQIRSRAGSNLRAREVLKEMTYIVRKQLHPMVTQLAPEWPEGMGHWKFAMKQEKKSYQKRRQRETLYLPAGISKVAEIPYDPNCKWTIKNLGKSSVSLYLSEDGQTPVPKSNPRTLKPGRTTQIRSKTLGPSGHILCTRGSDPVVLRMVVVGEGRVPIINREGAR